MSEERDDLPLLDEVREIKPAEPDRDDTSVILKEKRRLTGPLADDEAKKRMRAYSRRGFLAGGAAALIGVFGWRWMPEETKQKLLRRTFEFNERVSQVFYRPSRLAPEFPRDSISPPRVNGGEGMSGEFDPAKWTLSVGGLAGRTGDLVLTLDDIRALPRTEMTTELKCIEGLDRDRKLGGRQVFGFRRRVRPADAKWCAGGYRRPPARPAALCFACNARQCLLCRVGHPELSAPADPARLRDERRALAAGTRRPLEACIADEIRHQADQADRPDRFYRRAPERLLGGKRLRLVFRTLDRFGIWKDNFTGIKGMERIRTEKLELRTEK